MATPDWMDFLAPESPAFAQKRLERALYVRRWAAHLAPGCRVLDLGGGIGRFSQWALELGCEVVLVDADPSSVACAQRHLGGHPGFSAHVAPVEALPELAVFDVVIAAELLCYVAHPEAVLSALRARLKPGGVVLLSVEARWGWAAALDAPAGQVEALLGDGVVHVPGDRFVRTYSESALRELCGGWELLSLHPSHYTLSGPFEALAGELTEAELLALEDRFAASPELAHLGRAWLAVLRS